MRTGLIAIVCVKDGEAEPSAFVDITRPNNLSVPFHVSLPRSGNYRLQFRYANGSADVRFENKCAVRSLFIDGYRVGPIVLPQRGKEGDWSNWGMSGGVVAFLKAGMHEVTLRFESTDENMNPDVNRALIDALYVTPVGKAALGRKAEGTQ